MPISELSIALQKGVVDAAVTPYAALKSFKLIDLTKHITKINHSGTLMVILMNKKKWNSLPDYAKKAIDQVANRDFGLKAAAAYVQEDLDNIKMGRDVNLCSCQPLELKTKKAPVPGQVLFQEVGPGTVKRMGPVP
jgi:TRAP-type C4-dicarboxylate transport system substrate-binding protein